MKKIFTALFAATVLGGAVFATDAELVVRYGVFGQGNAIVNGNGGGDLGGGFTFEYGMPFYIAGKQNGFGVKIDGDALLGAKSPVKSGADYETLLSYWVRFPFGLTDFAFQPELDYGVIYKETDDGTAADSKMDQKLVVGLSFRYNPLNIAGGKMEFELTPEFGIEFHKDPTMYFGGRLGVHYIFGKNAGTDERIAARENGIVDLTAKEIANDPDLKDAVSVYRSPEGVTICLDSINFLPDSSDLEPSEYVKLDKVVRMLKQYTNTLKITGHCAKTPDGTDEEDIKFSKERAQTVADYLIKKGVRSSNTKIRVYGKGSSEPRADNDTEEGRKLNRRVEVTLVRKM